MGCLRRRKASVRLASAVFAMLATFSVAPSLVQAQPKAAPRASTASKPSASNEAKARFDRGVALFDDGDYSAALIEFERAYELAPNFRVLYNMGKVEEQLQRYPAAIRSFERYLGEGGKDVPVKRRAEVEREIRRLRERLATIAIEGKPLGAMVFVDDVAFGSLPLAEPLVVSSGRRKIELRGDGGVLVGKTVDVAGGDSIRVELVAEPPRPVVQPRMSPIAKAVWIGSGVAAAGALATGAFALRENADRRDALGALGLTSSELASKNGAVRTFALSTDVLGAAAILGSGVALYLTLRPSTASAEVGLTLGPRGISATGSF